MSRNIILTGFMGTGKSTVGRLLAQRLGYDFVDTDEMIAEQQGCSVATIFRDRGEPAFRQMEAELARALAARERLVISTGGRLMLDPTNRDLLSRSGLVICLTATPAEIVVRLQQGGVDQRPLLSGPDPELRIRELLRERETGYGQYRQLSTSEKSPADVVDELYALLP